MTGLKVIRWLNTYRNSLRIVLLWIVLPLNIVTAQLSIPLNREITQRIESSLKNTDPLFFTCWKPFSDRFIREKTNIDSLLCFEVNKKYSSWFGRKLFQESLLQIDSSDFSIRVDPLFNFSLGKEFGNSQHLITNTRGARVVLRIGKDIGIESSIYESQTFFPTYWDNFILENFVVPGQGRTKRYHTTGWDYAYSQGYIRWTTGKHVEVQFGQDKNFIGDGYRSLFLSDGTTNYPFLKASFTWKNFQYTRMISSFMNMDVTINNKDVKAFPKKTANFHLISFNFSKKLQASFFEGTILKNPYNSSSYRLNFDLIDPVPYLNNLLRTPDSNNPVTSVSGINLKWVIFKDVQLYNQWMCSNLFGKDLANSPTGKRYGIQAGIKYYPVLGIENLFLQAEFNKVMPFSYSSTDSTVAYGQFSQPLAHPLGANFDEGIGIINYRYHRWFAEYMGCFATYGENNGNKNSGHNLFLPDPGQQSVFLQGIKTNLAIHQFRISWYLNQATNMCLSSGLYFRAENSPLLHNSTKMVFISFSTNLRNIYYDF